MIGLYFLNNKNMSLINFIFNSLPESVPSITDWLSVGIYFLTLIAAVIAAVIAYKALVENKKLTKAQAEPFVVVRLEVMKESLKWFRLKVSNEGMGQAFKIKIVLSVDQETEDNKNIIQKFSSPKFMQNGLEYLAPKECRYSNFFIVKDDISASIFFATSLKASVTYKNVHGNMISNEFIIDIREFDGEYRIGTTFGKDLISSLKNINDSVIKINNENKRFYAEEEKKSRPWTEEELRSKVNYFDKQRAIRAALGQNIEEPLSDKRVLRKMSIQQMRKLNK